MITIGEKVRFDPLEEIRFFGSRDQRWGFVEGTVVMVNEPHEWFSVEYECGGVKQRSSFKFSQIGMDVMVCGH